MPKVSGLEVLQRLWEDGRIQCTPVVVLTPSREACDLRDSDQLFANGDVRKPIDFVQFMTVVKQLTDYWLYLNEFPLPPCNAKCEPTPAAPGFDC